MEILTLSSLVDVGSVSTSDIFPVHSSELTLLEEEDRPHLCRHDIRERVYAGQRQLLVISCKVRWLYL